jgi:hypothetical protein
MADPIADRRCPQCIALYFCPDEMPRRRRPDEEHIMAIHAGVRTYRGSCHCGAVRFEVDLDLSQGSSQCNCSICSKTGWWGILVKPSAFRMVTGEELLLTLPRIPQSDHPRCTICGVPSFNRGDVPQIGGEFYSVNVRCLDDVDLSGLPITYLDGLHNTWAPLNTQPYVSPFLGAGKTTLQRTGT